LEWQLQVFREHPQAGLVAAGDVADLKDGWPALAERRPEDVLAITLEDLLVRSRFGASSVLLRKACLDRVGLFAAGFAGVEDRDLWLRFAQHFAVYKLLRPLWWYRIHETSMSFAVIRMEANELKVLRNAFATMPCLRGRWGLKRKALSRALVANAHMYDVTRMYPRALTNLIRSVWLWPVPFRRGEVNRKFLRPKMFLLILKRWLTRK
jgi:hypothetical protein